MSHRTSYKRAVNGCIPAIFARRTKHITAEPLESRLLLSTVSINVLAAFSSATGATPTGAIAMDAAGDLFGTTEGTFPQNDGVIWELKKSGSSYASTPTVLASFPTDGSFGEQPKGGVAIDSQGNLFGTTYLGFDNGVDGTFWELPKTQNGYGALQLRAVFDGTNGQNPLGQLYVDSNDNVFGTAVGNSARAINGSIWEYSSDGTFTVLVSLDGNGPYNSESSLVRDSAGNLYGTTVDKGTGSVGTVFQVAFSQTGGFASTATTIASFDGNNGATPTGQISIDSVGNLYGTSRGDGTNNLGTIWELFGVNGIPGNNLTSLGTFNAAGTVPIGGAFLSNGNLYGTTSAGVGNSTAGTFWTISPASVGGLTTLTTFSAATNGSSPVSNILTDGNGDFFSTAQNGGSGGRGTIVEIKSASVSASAATHLSIVQQPGSTLAGHHMGPFLVVRLLDAKNQIVLTDTSAVTVTVSSPAGTTLGGTLTENAVLGTATFADLSITQVGTYTLTVTDSALKSDKTGPIKITPDISSTHLVLIQPAGPTLAGKALASIVLHTEDQYNNLVTVSPNNPVPTLSIVSGPTSNTLTGATTAPIKNGVVTFSKLVFDTAGDYNISIAASALVDPTPVQFVQTITKGVTTVAAPHASASYTFGQTIALSTTFKSTAPSTINFTGTATIVDQNNHTLGAADLTTKGGGKFNLANVAPGTYTCTVNYPGDADHTAVTSSTFTLVVKPAPTKATLVPSSTHVHTADTLALTANVASTTGLATPLTGSVVFSDNGTVIGTIPLTAGAAILNIPNPTSGHHSYTAAYSGDANFAISTSSKLALTVSN